MLSVSLEAAELLDLAQWKDDAALEAALAKPDFRRRLPATSAPTSFSIS